MWVWASTTASAGQVLEERREPAPEPRRGGGGRVHRSRSVGPDPGASENIAQASPSARQITTPAALERLTEMPRGPCGNRVGH